MEECTERYLGQEEDEGYDSQDLVGTGNSLASYKLHGNREAETKTDDEEGENESLHYDVYLPGFGVEDTGNESIQGVEEAKCKTHGNRLTHKVRQ